MASPSILMYLSFQCPSDSPSIAALMDAEKQLVQKFSEKFLIKLHKSHGSVYREPFHCLSVEYSLTEYNIELWEQYTNALFDEFYGNRIILSELSRKHSIVTYFTVNINSMNSDERPVFYLSSEQIFFLAELRASLSFDGYLMFGDEDEK